MKVHLLGPVRVVSQDGSLVTPSSVAQRQLIALLALRAGEVVPTDTMCESLQLTPGAVRTTISRVRRLLGPSFVITESPGYALCADTDAARFEALVAEAATAPLATAVLRQTEALELFRWEALPEFAHHHWAEGAVRRLDEIRSHTVEDLAENLIQLGRPTDAIAELDTHIVAHPYRERPRELLMRALAMDGRQTEALRTYQSYRHLLIEEVGGEPSAHLRDVESAIAIADIGPRSKPLRTPSLRWRGGRPIARARWRSTR